MPSEPRGLQIKRDRRSIMALLNMNYPRYMAGEEVFRIVLDGNPEYDRRWLVKDMTYLHERGYVEFKGLAGIAARTISVQHCQFKLTACGTDVANQIVEDPTLDI